MRGSSVRAGTAVIVAIMMGLAIPALADHRLTEGRNPKVGAALYADACAACHGARLEGQPDWRVPGPDGVLPAPPHDATGHTWHHDTPMLLAYTLDGGQATLAARGVTGFTSGMPAFRDALTEDQVLDILAYIRASWPPQAQVFQRERTHAQH